MAKKVRNYKKEAEYHARPEQKLRRADRNRARRKALRDGRVHKGDGKEVDHIGSHRLGRLKNVATRIVDRITNRKKQPKRS